MTDTIADVETINFSYKKSKATVMVLIFVLPIFWGIGGWFLSLYLAFISGRNAGGAPWEVLIAAIVALAVFIPIPIAALISFALNSFVISGGRVFIRKGLSGRSISFGIDEALSFQHAYSRGKNGQSSHKIIFYLKCGKIIRTNKLYINIFDLERLLEILRSCCEGRGYSAFEMKRIASENAGLPLPEVRRNVIPPVIMALPFAVALLAAVHYLVTYVL